MIRWFASSEIGPREEQQDAFAFGARVGVIADGMGGHPGGREAALETVRAVMHELERDADLEAAIEHACAEVPAASPGGSTVVALRYLDDEGGPRVRIAWVGDSRAYLVRGAEAERLTEDHVAADGGLDRWVPDEGIPDLVEVALEPGDALVLCTDGVWNVLGAARIAELVSAAGDPAEALVRQAIDDGAGDNCTALVCTALESTALEPAALEPAAPGSTAPAGAA